MAGKYRTVLFEKHFLRFYGQIKYRIDGSFKSLAQHKLIHFSLQQDSLDQMTKKVNKLIRNSKFSH
jgi:hypothetical protein